MKKSRPRREVQHFFTMSSSVKATCVQLWLLFVFCKYVSCLIVPDEIPTVLSLVYSNIPPIKKGTDSRLGIGFRLGEHADVQLVVELGPQTNTDPIGTDAEAKRRRDIMMDAIKGNMGPWAQMIAKYQIQRKLQKEIEKLKKYEAKTQNIKLNLDKANQKKTEGSEWLVKWSKDMLNSDTKYETTDKPVNVQRISVVNGRSTVNADTKQ